MGWFSPQVRNLKEPQQIMQGFSTEQVSTLLRFKPRTDFERRLHLLILILLGISEVVLLDPGLYSGITSDQMKSERRSQKKR